MYEIAFSHEIFRNATPDQASLAACFRITQTAQRHADRWPHNSALALLSRRADLSTHRAQTASPMPESVPRTMLLVESGNRATACGNCFANRAIIQRDEKNLVAGTDRSRVHHLPVLFKFVDGGIRAHRLGIPTRRRMGTVGYLHRCQSGDRLGCRGDRLHPLRIFADQILAGRK